jgi:hypothetical protein
VHLTLANISVGAKHDRIQYGIITNNLSAVMLRPLQKPDAPPKKTEHPEFALKLGFNNLHSNILPKWQHNHLLLSYG